MTSPTASRAPAAETARRSFLLSPWFPALLGALCYLHTLGGDFTYDDNSIVRQNPLVRSLADWRAIWLRDWWYSQGEQSGGLTDPSRDRLYRPLTIFSFALNFAAHGLQPAGFHAVNVVLHAAVCGLVWLLARRLLGDPLTAAIAATVFAVHPIHAEPVAGIVGRAEILSALFILLGLIALLPRAGPLTSVRAALAALAMLAALLAKETAICFPALAAIVLWWRQRTSGRREIHGWIAVAIAIVVALVVYFSLRYVALEQRFIRSSAPNPMLNPIVDADGPARWLAPLSVLGHYTRLMLAPLTLSCDYGYAIIEPGAGATLMTLVGALAAIGLCLAVLRPTRRIGMLALLFLASYALISNTMLVIGVSLAERLFYWPSVPVSLAIALGLSSAWSRFFAPKPRSGPARMVRLAAWGAVLALGLRSAARAADWASDQLLFAADQRNWPQGVHLATARAQLIVTQAEGLPLGRERDATLAAAREMLLAVLKRVPRYSSALRLLGVIEAYCGRSAKAIDYFEQAVTLSPEDRFSQRWLVELRGGAADTEQRIVELERRVGESPRDVAARLALAAAYLELGRSVEGLRQYEAAYDVDPQNADVLRGLGQALAVNLQNDLAAEVFQRLLSLNADDWIAHANLALLLAEREPAAALQHAQRAFELQPNDFRARMNLAAALAVNHRFDEAIGRYREALALLPADDSRRALIADRIRELTERQP
jgi:tetratricopeptide (TPR) repeat protein